MDTNNSNFTAKYLGVLKNVITDGKGIPIETLKTLKNENFFFLYKKPRIICDVLLTGRILVEPKIREIKYEDLIRMGFCIVSIKKKIRRGKSVVYKIIKKARNPLKELNVLDRIPQKHYIEYDLSNYRIRIMGPNSGPLNMGEWIYTGE